MTPRQRYKKRERMFKQLRKFPMLFAEPIAGFPIVIFRREPFAMKFEDWLAARK